MVLGLFLAIVSSTEDFRAPGYDKVEHCQTSNETKEAIKSDKAGIAHIKLSSRHKGFVDVCTFDSLECKGEIRNMQGQRAVKILVLSHIGQVEANRIWCRMKGSLALIDHKRDSTVWCRLLNSIPHSNYSFLS